jgi:transcriptional regulator with XRE-family HTH domain
MALATDECVDDRPDVDAGSSTVAPSLRPQPFDPPGVLLRERREERGLTIDDLARTTKISKSILRAIEGSDAVHLPAAIYTRGFVKAYAQEVGLNPESTANEYLHRIELPRPERLLVDGGRPPRVSARPIAVEAIDDARSQLATNHVRRLSGLLTAAAVIGLILYVASFTPREDPRLTSELTDTSSTDAVTAASDESADSPQRDAATAVFEGGPFRLELVTQGQCWVSARVDGQHVVYKLLGPGERHTLDISDEVVLRIGEPGALSLSINGHAGRSLGPAGQPVTVRITKDNFRDFLSS